MDKERAPRNRTLDEMKEKDEDCELLVPLGEGKRKAEEFEGMLVSVFTPEKTENISG